MKPNVYAILNELKQNVEYISETQMDALAQKIDHANHIFLTGKGRSGLSISAFANRLLHLGYSVSMIGEISAPHTHENDLVIIASGSGETDALVAIAKKAKSEQLDLVCLTMNEASTIAQMADLIVVIPGVSPKVESLKAISSIQPMGSAFEQMLFLSLDALVLSMMDKKGLTSDQMFANHANIE